MASLTKARELYAKGSAHAERGEWLQAARDQTEAFKQARDSTARGSAAFAYRMWNAAVAVAGYAERLCTDQASRTEAARVLAWLRHTDQNCREPLARLRALRLDRNIHPDGPVVWAAQNHEAARELEELEEEVEKIGGEV